MTKQELIAAVKAHALANYENGWDTLVECFSDADIEKALGNASTVTGATRNVARNLGLRVSKPAAGKFAVRSQHLDGSHDLGRFTTYARAKAKADKFLGQCATWTSAFSAVGMYGDALTINAPFELTDADKAAIKVVEDKLLAEQMTFAKEGE